MFDLGATVMLPVEEKNVRKLNVILAIFNLHIINSSVLLFLKALLFMSVIKNVLVTTHA